MISDSVNPSALHCRTVWHRPVNVVPPATDDHPFVYLDGDSIPGFTGDAARSCWPRSSGADRLRAVAQDNRLIDLFFMGAAFMLLETKNVVQFALLFGTTWFVNALVTGGPVAVFAAVEVSRHMVVRRPALLYAALLAALVSPGPCPRISAGPVPLPRFVPAVLIAFTPIFLANMVFSHRFRDIGDSTTAFGANLLGAMVGGVLEYASLVSGARRSRSWWRCSTGWRS